MIKQFCDICGKETDNLNSIMIFTYGLFYCCPKCHKKLRKFEKKYLKQYEKERKDLNDKYIKQLKEFCK